MKMRMEKKHTQCSENFIVSRRAMFSSKLRMLTHSLSTLRKRKREREIRAHAASVNCEQSCKVAYACILTSDCKEILPFFYNEQTHTHTLQEWQEMKKCWCANVEKLWSNGAEKAIFLLLFQVCALSIGYNFISSRCTCDAAQKKTTMHTS